MNDSALYTGIDGDPDGVFGNEVVDEKVQKKLDAQKAQLKELTPKLTAIISMIKAERASVIEGIADFVDNSINDESVDRSEIKAAARYRKYLDNLMTKFSLALNETKR